MNLDFSLFGFQLSLLDAIGAVIGLFYIVSEYRAGRWFWPLSLFMSAFYAVIDLKAHYYANALICVYNFVMSIYGILVWRGVVQSKDKSERQIGSCPTRYWMQINIVVAALFLLLWQLLGMFRQSEYPLIDGLSSALTIVGMVMLSQKWWQQWYCWMIVEPLMIVLFLLGGLYASALLYVVFEVFCILGLIRWRKEAMKNEAKVKELES